MRLDSAMKAEEESESGWEQRNEHGEVSRNATPEARRRRDGERPGEERTKSCRSTEVGAHAQYCPQEVAVREGKLVVIRQCLPMGGGKTVGFQNTTIPFDGRTDLRASTTSTPVSLNCPRRVQALPLRQIGRASCRERV